MALQLEQVITELHGFAAVTSKTLERLSEPKEPHEGIDARTLQKPEVWKPKDHDEELTQWPEWSFLFKSFMAMLDKEFESDLDLVEQNLTQEQVMADYPTDMVPRAKRLYHYLVSYVKARPLRIVRAVDSGDGFKAWQHLCREFQPNTRQRTLCMIQAITQFPAFEKGKVLEGLLSLEKLVEDYERVATEKLSSDLKVATLIRCCPVALRQHLELNVSKTTSYTAVRDALTTYEQTTSAWTSGKILKQAQNYKTEIPKDDPMDVDRVEWKGYYKGGKGKGKGKDKGKGKGKFDSKGKSSGKGSWNQYGQKGDKGGKKSKGKGKDPKGKGKETRKCHNCGKVGHLADDCWSPKKNQQQVRQVDEEQTTPSTSPTRSQVASSSSSTTTSSSSSTTRVPGSVRRLTASPVHRLETPPGMNCCRIYDMAEEEIEDEKDKHFEVRMVKEGKRYEDSTRLEAILDLGAEVSVLPMDLACFGEIEDERFKAFLSDAQGNAIHNKGKVKLTMMTQTEDGKYIGLRESFILANVKQPLLALGRWMKKGWDLKRSKDGGTHHYLVSKHHRVPLIWKNNSLAFEFFTKASSINYLVNLGDELGEISRENGWWMMRDGTPTLVVKRGFGFQDPSSYYSVEEYPYRSTLVRLADGSWDCVEHSEPYAHMRSGKFEENIPVPTCVLTLLHKVKIEPQQQDDQGQVGMAVDEQDQQPREDELPPEQDLLPDLQGGPLEPVEHPVPDGVLADELGDDYVIVNGQRIEPTSSLRTMRAACGVFGIGKSGGKQVIYKRLLEHARKGHARMALEIALKNREDGVRIADGGPALAQAPDAATQERHRLTHLPFEPWCEVCVATRSRDNERHERRESPVPTVALDYMFTNTSVGQQRDSQMVKHLAGVDSWTKALLCVPIPGKGGISLKRCTAAVTAFTRDYEDVILKGDGEPSMKQLISAVTAARSAMKLKTQVEYIPQGHSQSNPAERAIQTVRRLGNTLLEEVRVGAKIQLPSSHVLFSWAYGHAAWLYNRYNVGPNKQTPFEVATGRPYKGRLATFGSAVYGQPLPHTLQQRKGLPAWRKGIFVGKLPDCDLAVMCSNKGLFVSRGIRRCAQEWQPDLLMAIKGQPWEERDTPGPKPGMKALRRERWAMREEVRKEFAEDAEAQAVVLYARERAAAALRSSQRSAADGVGEALPQQVEEDEEPQEQEPQVGMQEQPVPVEQEVPNSSEDVELFAEEAPTVDKRGIEEGGEQHRPKVPRLSELPRGEEVPQGGQVVGTTSSTSSTTRLAASPTFAGNITQVSLDENEEVEVDEEFVLHPEDWGDWNNLDFNEMDKSEDDGPPQLGQEELKKLEEEADLCEEKRLLEMGVLIPVEEENQLDDDYRLMTSRSVYDWRFRDGHWVRRSRLVARDYKFLQPELEGLFSPASNSLGTKVWAALVQSAGGSLSLYSADVKDAYLMVQQDEKVYVTLNDKKYILGRCLPGQRVGSKSWYDLLALVLRQKGLVSYKANPSLFYKKVENEKQRPLIVSTHVDDLQIIGDDGEVQELLQHLRDQGWKLQVDGPCGPHVQGSCSFLKRKFLSDGQGKLWVKLNNRYVEKLVEILNLGNSKEKGVPTTGNFQKGLEYKPVSPEESRTFRTCVGILLYMSTERPDIQCATRSLASKVTKPDEGDWRELKQVVLYLKGTKDYAQVMKSTGSMSSALTRIFHPEGDDGDVRADASRGPSTTSLQ